MKGDLESQLRAAIGRWKGSLYSLAELSGVSYSQIHRFVSGKRTITMPAADKLASALGLALQPVPKRKSSR